MRNGRAEATRRHRASLREALLPLGGVERFGTEGLTEVMINPDGRLWLDLAGQGLVDTGETIDPAATRVLITTAAGLLEKVVDEHRPILEGEVPFEGWRIEGLLPPVVRQPAISIRVPARRAFPFGSYFAGPTQTAAAPEDELSGEVLAPAIEAALAAEAEQLAATVGDLEEVVLQAALQRKNLLVAGGTSSAKTSFVKALHQALVERGDRCRYLVVEDVFELRLAGGHVVELQTTDTADLLRLLRVCLRMRPDRIWVGEVRGPEALPMLKAWNTGHSGGVGTIHANSAAEALHRLEELIAEGGTAPHPAAIARTIDWIVFLQKAPSGRRWVSEVVEVVGWREGAYQLRPVKAR